MNLKFDIGFYLTTDTQSSSFLFQPGKIVRKSCCEKPTNTIGTGIEARKTRKRMQSLE